MSLPDFMIIGAMKCGTSTLQTQLAEQPGVFMTTPKEPNFFSDDDVYAKGPAWYSSLFASAAPGDLKGEASTHYTKLPTYPHTLPRMREMLTQPKLIYMVRNPVERAVSQFIHEWSQGHVGMDMEHAISTAPEFIDYGRYAMQITPFLEAYGPDAVYLTSLEVLNQDPQAELTRIGVFLNAPSPLQWRDDIAPQNVSKERIKRFPMHKVVFDNPVAQTLRRSLVPQSLRTRLKRYRTIDNRPSLSDGLRQHLQEVYAEDHAALSRLFPDHPVLTGSYPFLNR